MWVTTAQCHVPQLLLNCTTAPSCCRALLRVPPSLFSRRVVSNSPAAAGPLHKVVIDMGPLAAGYTVPGQFVQVGLVTRWGWKGCNSGR